MFYHVDSPRYDLKLPPRPNDINYKTEPASDMEKIATYSSQSHSPWQDLKLFTRLNLC